jgi:hypothetical protein
VEWTAHPFCKLETKIGRTDEKEFWMSHKSFGQKGRLKSSSSRSNTCGHCCCLSALSRLSYWREAFLSLCRGSKAGLRHTVAISLSWFMTHLIFSYFVLIGLSAKSCRLNLFLEHINFSWSSSILRYKIGKNYKRRMMYYKEKNYVHYFECPRKKTNMRSFFLLDFFIAEP